MLEIILVLIGFFVVVMIMAKYIHKILEWIIIIATYGILFVLSAVAGMIIVFLYKVATS
jgi:hypothetical protein